MPFDQWVSLGYRCEVAFQVRRTLGHDVSGFFAWNVTDFEPLCALLENDFAGVMQSRNIGYNAENGLMLDNAYGYSFHGSFATKYPEDDPAFEERMAEQREKTTHFVERFRTVEGRRCYFYLCRESITPQQVERLCNAVARYGGDFTLVILRHEKYRDEPITIDGCHDRYMERLAPLADMTDGHVRSWDRIFVEFPHKDAMHLSGF